MESSLYFKNREEWRIWLEGNYDREKEVWLLYYKKHTGKPTIPYDDAVEEALCFGWIDTTVRRIDDETYMQKFTPRKDKSNWSDLNKKRVEKLIDNGIMMQAGLDKINAANSNGSWDRSSELENPDRIPKELDSLLSSNKEAKDFYLSLSPSNRKQYIWWIASAKKAETREKRAKEALFYLSQKKKFGLR